MRSAQCTESTRMPGIVSLTSQNHVDICFLWHNRCVVAPCNAAVSLPSSNEAAATIASSPPCAAPEVESKSNQWFRVRVHPHGGQLKNYLRSAFPSVRDVDDVDQESYLRIWQAKASIPINFGKAFLYKVARNIAIDLIRRDHISPITLSGDLAALPVPEDRNSVADTLTEQEKISLVGDAVVALPTRTRAIFILHKFKGLKQSDVAQELGLSEKTVEHQVARGMHLCEQYLRARGHELF